MVPVTRNFASEAPLSPAVSQALGAAFDQGWADPKKISQSAVAAQRLRNQAIEAISAGLHLRPDQIEISGEPDLLPYLAIAGIEVDAKSLFVGATERGKVRAVARNLGATTLPVTRLGQLHVEGRIALESSLAVQCTNSETGVRQNLEALSARFSALALDATFSGIHTQLPTRWSTAFFDAKSWGGPAGIGILAINKPELYRYPLPHIAPIRVPGSYSLPLLIAAAVAIEETHKDLSKVVELRDHLLRHLFSLENVEVIHAESGSDPRVLSFRIVNQISEETVRRLEKSGFVLDAGSACAAQDLQPSHVLAEMGYETSGHLRVTLRNEQTSADIDALVAALRR